MKKTLWLSLCTGAAIVAIALIMLHSAQKYRIMSMTEQLKAQLEGDDPAYAAQLIEHIEVEKTWHSLSPSGWTFVVTLSPDSETLRCRYVDGGFRIVQP